MTSSLNLTTNSKHSSPFPRLPSGVNNLTQSASTASINQEIKSLARPKTVSLFILFLIIVSFLCFYKSFFVNKTKFINLNQTARLPPYTSSSERKLVTFDDK